MPKPTIIEGTRNAPWVVQVLREAVGAESAVHVRAEGDAAAIPHFERALELDSNFAMAHGFLGGNQAIRGDFAAARTHLDLAWRLSPRDPILWATTVTHALADVLAGDTETALVWVQKTMQLPRASGYWPHAVKAAALAQAGRSDEAKVAVQTALGELPKLSISYLAKALPTKQPDGLDPYLDALRTAGLPE